MNTIEARTIAADYLGGILTAAYEDLSAEEIETELKVSFEDALSILFEMGSATAAVYWDDHTAECTCDDFEDAEVGDPDPTNTDEDAIVCAETDGRYLCTRDENHDGKHIAGDGETVCAVWV